MEIDLSNLSHNIPSILLDYWEGQSRQNNVVIDGIYESAIETWAESKTKVRKLF